MRRRFLIVALASLAYAATPAWSRTFSPSDLNPVAEWDRLPPPPLMKGIGDAAMKITTSSPAAQVYFDQGLRLLHCFWYFEAYRAFKEVARLDSSAPMAYWGMAESLANFPTLEVQASASIETAETLMSRASDRERRYIRAEADLLEMPGDEGREGYVHDMQALIEKYPDDINAQTFLAFFVMSGYGADGRATPGELYSQTLLRRILASHPGNVAANHYWIHAVEDGPAPEQGLKSAQLLSRVAPNSGHLVHMAGHIYFRLGDYQQARRFFLQSMRTDERYLSQEHIPPRDDVNYEHNLSYLVAACAEAGRYQEALAWAKKLGKLRAPLAYGASALNDEIPLGSTMLRLHLRFADWQAAASDPLDAGIPRSELGPAAIAYADAWHRYAQGMAALAKGPSPQLLDDASRESSRIVNLVESLSALESQAEGARAFWIGGAVQLLKVASLELRGRLAVMKGDNAQGFELLKTAIEKEKELGYTDPPYYARPVEETLGDVYLGTHQWDLARAAFSQELEVRPHSGFALFWIARSYQLEGRTRDAVEAYDSFLRAWANADGDLPQVSAAKSYLAAHEEAMRESVSRNRAGDLPR